MHSSYDHMQNHADRDRNIYVYFNNIIPAFRRNFQKVDARSHSDFGTPYDFYSVMHYDAHAFAINKDMPTMIARKRRFRKVIGQRKGMSRSDYLRINRMYSCEEIKNKLF